MVPLILIAVAILLGSAVLTHRRARLPQPSPPIPFERFDTPPTSTPFELGCPHCGYKIVLEDLSVVGHSLGCPQCDGAFMVLEPAPDERAPAATMTG